MDRRQFLRQVVVGGVGLALLPAITTMSAGFWESAGIMERFYMGNQEIGRWYPSIPRLEVYDGKQWKEVGAL